MTWTKLGDELGSEARDLSDAEFRTHIEALVWSSWRMLDLYVPKRDLHRFAETADPEAAAAGLVAKDWWTDAGESWYIGVRFPEWQLERSVIEYRRVGAALRKRRQRMHEAGDHSICLPGRCADVTRDGTRDPGRVGTGRGAVRPKVNSTGERDAAAAADDAGGERQPEPFPSPQNGDGPRAVVHDDQHSLGEGSAVASHQTVTRARRGQQPLDETKRITVLELHTAGLSYRKIADAAGVSVGTAFNVVHQNGTAPS